MKIKIEINKNYKKWNEQKDLNKRYLMLILSEILVAHENFNKLKSVELSILLTNDNEISKINLEYRNKSGPTNVLSFPDTDEILHQNNLQIQELYLGDLAFSYDRIIEESLEKNISFYNHFTHLLIHGILHLIGYDHIEEEEAKKMEQLEEVLLMKLNIPTPY
jgi:probable rRNA maturation factor